MEQSSASETVPAQGPPDEASETARLRAEVEALRAQLAATEVEAPGRRSPARIWRPVLTAVLLCLVVVLAPLSVVATWAHRQVSDTNQYVATVAPLASDPAVQKAISDRITTEVLSYVDVKGLTTQVVDALNQRGLPDGADVGLRALTVPLVRAIENFVAQRVDALVRSDAFARAWVSANKTAHEQLVVALTGKTGGVTEVNGGEVSINLATLIAEVKKELVDRGFNVASKIPVVDTKFTVMKSQDLVKAQGAFSALNTLATALPIVTLLLIGGAIAAARRRRRAVVAAGLSVAAGMILLALGLIVVRPLYLAAIPADQLPRDAAAAFFDAFVGSIRTSLRAILLVALVATFVAWVSGPGPTAVRVRHDARGLMENLRDLRARGFATNAAGRFLRTYRIPLRITIAALAVTFLVFSIPISTAIVVATLLVAVAVWLVIELLTAPDETGLPTTGLADTGLAER